MKSSQAKNQDIPRILHSPVNICGIGRDLADWQRENKSAKSDFIVFSDRTFLQNSHKNLQLNNMGYFKRLIYQWRFFKEALISYDIFHFYFGKSLLPFNIDMPFLRLAGKNIIMTYAGTDIRLKQVEIRNNPYFYLRYKGKKVDYPGIIKRMRMIWHSFWIDYCIAIKKLSIFAQTSIPKKKILSDLWVNTTIDVPKNTPKFRQSKRPMIIHAPTNFQTKGTKYVQEAIDLLRLEGMEFDFKLFHEVPHGELIDFLINDSDIVVDQLLSGSFGSFASEAMSYGKPVCGYITEDLRHEIPDLPIVQSTVDTLADRLRELILDSEKRQEIGLAGWNFARSHFDRDLVCKKLWQIYMDMWSGQK